jgi:hypothetical protein
LFAGERGVLRAGAEATMDSAVAQKPKRRVYAAEFKSRLGVGDTWLRELEKRGRIPKSHIDPGGKRKWWSEDEVNAVIAGQWPERSLA